MLKHWQMLHIDKLICWKIHIKQVTVWKENNWTNVEMLMIIPNIPTIESWSCQHSIVHNLSHIITHWNKEAHFLKFW